MFFIVVLKHLGLSFAYFFLRFVAAYFLLFSYNSVKSLLYFYRSRLGLGLFPALIAVYNNFYTFGQILLDKVALFNGFSNRIGHISEGNQHLNQIAEMGKGGILICAHFGGWELSGQLMEELGFKPKILMLEAEHKKIKQVIDASPSSKKLDIIPVKDDYTHILRVAKSLKKKELIAIHGDRFLQGTKTIRLPFLGEETEFPLGPFAMAVQLKVPVSFIFTTKEKGFNYRYFASPVHYPSEKDIQADKQQQIGDLAVSYINTFEEFVKKYSHQWFNFYDFWQKGEKHAPN